MKVKHTLIVLVIGFILVITGAVFKIFHLEMGALNGKPLLLTGLFIEIVGGILLVYKLLSQRNIKNFLNS